MQFVKITTFHNFKLFAGGFFFHFTVHIYFIHIYISAYYIFTTLDPVYRVLFEFPSYLNQVILSIFLYTGQRDLLKIIRYRFQCIVIHNS